jgi:hypothetical protein
MFLAAYEDAIGHTLGDVALWDGWALARSYYRVETSTRSGTRPAHQVICANESISLCIASALTATSPV